MEDSEWEARYEDPCGKMRMAMANADSVNSFVIVPVEVRREVETELTSFILNLAPFYFRKPSRLMLSLPFSGRCKQMRSHG
jgi:hypothetical protein